MPAPIVIRNLTPETKMGNESPKIATREDLRSGARGDSGTVAPPPSENVIVLTGSNFEAVNDPRPSFEETMEYEGLSEGDLIPTGVRWQDNGGPFHSQMELSTELALPGRQFCAKSRGNKSKLGNPIIPADRPELMRGASYLSYMFAANESLMSPPQLNATRSDKWHRSADQASGDHTRISFEPNQSGGTGGRLSVYQIVDGYSDPHNYPQMGTAKNTPNVFHRIEQWILGSELWFSCNGVISGPYGFWHDSNADPGAPMRLTLLGHDVSQTDRVTSTLRTYNAEVYEQPTPARVELSNSPTWSPGGEFRRFYQKTVLRTNERIEFEPYYGDLDTEAPIYAYIIKSDGSVNQSGILITGATVNAGIWEA